MIIAGRLCMLLAAFWLAACAPEPTPFPGGLPSSSPAVTITTAISTATPEIISTASSLGFTVALSANAAQSAADLSAETANLITLASDGDASGLGRDYDLIAAYGAWDGWLQAPQPIITSLLISHSTPPLDQPEIRAIVRASIDAQAITHALGIPGASTSSSSAEPGIVTRTQMANAGYPDGLELRVAAVNGPGHDALREQMSSRNLDLMFTASHIDNITEMLTTEGYHLAVMSWRADEEISQWSDQGAVTRVDLFQVPISYQAIPGLDLQFSADGWPLPMATGD